MGKPQVTIEVDDATGVWTVDGLPMVLVPRHFLVNTHKSVEAAVGIEANARMAYEAGYKSAWYWCDQESRRHGLAGLQVFEHYMRRLSQRGWGQFRIVAADAQSAQASVHVAHSVFVAEYGRGTERAVCYPLTGWLVGSLEWAFAAMGRPRSLAARETSCVARDGGDMCLFEVVPRAEGSHAAGP